MLPKEARIIISGVHMAASCSNDLWVVIPLTRRAGVALDVASIIKTSAVPRRVRRGPFPGLCMRALSFSTASPFRVVAFPFAFS